MKRILVVDNMTTKEMQTQLVTQFALSARLGVRDKAAGFVFLQSNSTQGRAGILSVVSDETSIDFDFLRMYATRFLSAVFWR